jgi:MFS family permease
MASVVCMAGVALEFAVFELPALAVDCFLYGANVALYYGGWMGLLSVMFEKAERGRLMSLLGGLQRWAGVVGPLLGGAVVHVSSTRWAVAMQLPLIAVTLTCTLLSKSIHDASNTLKQQEATNTAAAAAAASESGSTGGAGGARATIKKLWQHRFTSLTVGGFACIVMAMRSGRRMMIPLIALRLSLAPFYVGAAVSLSYSVDATFFWVGGIVSDRFGRRWAALPTATLMALSYFALSFATSVPVFIACLVFFGAADTFGSGLLDTMVADTAPSDCRAENVALTRSILESGQLAGPLLMGLLMLYVDVRITCYVMGTLGLCAALIALFSSVFSSSLTLTDDSSNHVAPAVVQVSPQTPTEQQPLLLNAHVEQRTLPANEKN